jgi:hypothetical protein
VATVDLSADTRLSHALCQRSHWLNCSAVFGQPETSW